MLPIIPVLHPISTALLQAYLYGVWPDFMASDFKFILGFSEIGFELGLFFARLKAVSFVYTFV